MNKLPKICYGLDTIEHRAIIIKRGDMGYYKTDWPAGYTQDMIDELNEMLGVTREQAEAMYIGSMFGWDVPGADPDIYRDRFKK